MRELAVLRAAFSDFKRGKKILGTRESICIDLDAHKHKEDTREIPH